MRKNKPIEYTFASIAMFFGLAWVLLVPPFQAPDEPAHFLRAYMISEGHFFGVNNENKRMLGYTVPLSLPILISDVGMNEIVFNYEKKQDISLLVHATDIGLNPQIAQFIGFYNTCLYSPVPYFPQALGISLGRMLDLPVLYIFYLGRIFNLLFYIVICTIAIRFVPVLKLTAMISALLPLSLFLAASLSADGVLIATCLFYTCYVLYLALDQDKKNVSLKDIGILTGTAAVIALSKGPYIVLCLLYFLIPCIRFKNKRWFWLGGMSVVSLGIIAAAAWSYSLRSLYVPLPVSIFEQWTMIIADPFQFIAKIMRTFYWQGNLIRMAFSLGWLDVQLPAGIIYSYAGLLVVSSLKYSGEILKTSAFRDKGIGILTLLLLICVAICMAAYLSWPQQSDNVIEGVQGRYYLPIVFSFFVALYYLLPGKGIDISQKWVIASTVSLVVMLSATSYYITDRYYSGEISGLHQTHTDSEERGLYIDLSYNDSQLSWQVGPYRKGLYQIAIINSTGEDKIPILGNGKIEWKQGKIEFYLEYIRNDGWKITSPILIFDPIAQSELHWEEDSQR